MSLQRTPLFECHKQLGARIVDYAGWEMPVQYSGVKAEHLNVRSKAGLFDVSHMGELQVTGAQSLSALNGLLTNDLRSLSDGQALYTCCCNEDGGILDDLIVYREAAERWLVVCNAANRTKITGHLGQQLGGGAELEDRSDALSLIALQGPRAGGILAELLPPGQHPERFRFCDTELDGIKCRIARTGYTGEDGFELFVENEAAAKLWLRLLEVGQAHDLLPVGLAARDTLRLEAKLALYGNDINEETTPLEAGLGWTVKLDKPDFVGRAALLEQKSSGLKRKLVGFEMIGRGIARHGYPIVSPDGTQLGKCTSGAPSPSLGKNLGLAYLPLAQSEIGCRFLVDCRGKPVEAQVVPTPFYRKNKN